MTLPLPPLDGENLQYILDLIADAVADTGGRTLKLRFGTATLTWTAAAASAPQTVNHGMGSTPVAAFATMANAGAPWAAAQVDKGATQLTIAAHTTDGSAPTTTGNVDWFAIG